MRDHDVFLERALLEAERLTAAQLEAARTYMVEHRVGLPESLVATEVLTAREVALCRAEICEVPFINLDDYEPCYANTAILSRSIAERCCAFPLFMIEGVLTVAMDDPLNLDATDQIRQVARCDVDTVLADAEQIRSLIGRAYTMTDVSSVAVIADDDDAGEVAATEPV
ncbi:MAG: hypothetical protein KC983_11020, partial [Phycisphaerales bacterium]|nr:hypothetical protein [Phycisphaerales bacterium]